MFGLHAESVAVIGCREEQSHGVKIHEMFFAVLAATSRRWF
jgi:hypothetical protein